MRCAYTTRACLPRSYPLRCRSTFHLHAAIPSPYGTLFLVLRGRDIWFARDFWRVLRRRLPRSAVGSTCNSHHSAFFCWWRRELVGDSRIATFISTCLSTRCTALLPSTPYLYALRYLPYHLYPPPPAIRATISLLLAYGDATAPYA